MDAERIIKALKDIPTPEDLHISERHGYDYAIGDAIDVVKQLNKQKERQTFAESLKHVRGLGTTTNTIQNSIKNIKDLTEAINKAHTPSSEWLQYAKGQIAKQVSTIEEMLERQDRIVKTMSGEIVNRYLKQKKQHDKGLGVTL